MKEANPMNVNITTTTSTTTADEAAAPSIGSSTKLGSCFFTRGARTDRYNNKNKC